MKKTCTYIFLCFLMQSVYGQYQIGIIPRVSPDKMVFQKIGYTETEVRYGSPSINNRQVWGNIVPYDKVWRAGANSATIIEFGSPVNFDGEELDSGKYSFFLIPKDNDKWTAIFNKVSNQWGAFNYDEKEDALRLEVSPHTTLFKTENLSYSINQIGFKNGSIILSWDFIEIEVPFETNYLSEFEQEIEKRASAQPDYIKWIPYIQGAEHLVQINSNLSLAMLWINKAENIMNSNSDWNEQFYPRDYVTGHLYWTKAKLLAKDMDHEAAIESVTKLKSLKNTIYYDRKNKEEEIDDALNLWLEK